MEYYGNNDYRDYLALRHHGILGMKWGHRNGPPYPLGASDHSASEKKAGWRKSLTGDSTSSVRKKARYINKETKRASKRYDKEIKKSDKKVNKALERYAAASASGSKSVDKRREEYEDARINNDFVKRLKSKELDRINNMTSKDISEEKKAVAENRVNRMRNIQKEGFIEGAITNKKTGTKTEQLKSKRRVTDAERNQLKDDIKDSAKTSSKNKNPYIGRGDIETMKPPGPVGSKEYEWYMEALADSMNVDYKNGKFKARSEYPSIINSSDYSNYADYIKDYAGRSEMSKERVESLRKDDVGFDKETLSRYNKKNMSKKDAENILESLNDWEADGLSERDFYLKQRALKTLGYKK